MSDRQSPELGRRTFFKKAAGWLGVGLGGAALGVGADELLHSRNPSIQPSAQLPVVPTETATPAPR